MDIIDRIMMIILIIAMIGNLIADLSLWKRVKVLEKRTTVVRSKMP